MAEKRITYPTRFVWKRDWKTVMVLPAFLAFGTLSALAIGNAFASPNSDNRPMITVVHKGNAVSTSQGFGTGVSTIAGNAANNATDNAPVTIHPCATEDSDNCYRLFGGKDGNGKSFVSINGKTYYLAG